ncbi:MAG: tubulin-like doman-containing protein [Bifidobacterium tibiigranuli]|uniref:tubulin-like doman-containing protein n=1 Tax=Bifidobacterium tibiigranuli TaxID=2172043 RepID=UPI0026E98638|nr:tubulin-like doman-containing protein [Bifidobacterium tibiigranuli]MCI2185617.1 tubulin-like doman-containing protein [Bifidobacterium tibiigranuli]
MLNADGGIIDVSQQAEQDNAAVLCIGLGGTGINALRNLKAKIYNRVRPDDSVSGAKQYPHIKFLAVDTDRVLFNSVNYKSSAIEHLDPDQEFFDLSYGGPISEYFRYHASDFENDPSLKEWFRHTDIKALSAQAGAGGVRQLGRFLLIKKSAEFKGRLLRLAAEARIGLSDNAPTYVHIFSGVSGGTGGGIFLDVSYIVRDAFPEARTCGYFFLPDVNIVKGLPPTAEAFVRVNGYAAMQELDYCMNFERNGDSWHQQYRFGEIASRQKPIDLCYLITARDSAGNVLDDAYEYATNVVTDCEKAYAGDHSVGVHLYEGKEYVDDSGAKVKGRDWRLLPSPIPLIAQRECDVLERVPDS